MRHPEHDAIAATVRGWYTQPQPALGYVGERGRFGYYGRHVAMPGWGQVTIEDLDPAHVPELIVDLRECYGAAEVFISFDDPDISARVRSQVLAAGCTAVPGQTFLAHMGPRRQSPAISGLTVEAATGDLLQEYVITKQKGFANSDDDPDAQDIQAELRVRLAEAEDKGRFLLARLAGEAVATIGYYEGDDRFVFDLATRRPYRRRGIATRLLCDTLHQASELGCRSVIINADPEDSPVRLYRSLGFTDEVYWRCSFRLEIAPEG